MKLYANYRFLKEKSIQLLSKGFIDEYLEILDVLTKIEKRMGHLKYLN